MAPVKVVVAQRDFSAGEVDSDLKRDDERPEFKAGLRQASNVRILNSKKLSNRPGRRALFLGADRVEEILMAPGATYYIAFPAGFVRIYDSTGTQVLGAAMGWTADTARYAVYAIYDKSIYITFANQPVVVLTWNGVTTWTATTYAVTLTAGNQYRSPFLRISPKGVTMLPGAQTGAGVAVTFSAGMNLVAGMIGTRMRFVNRQVEIATVTGPTTGTINILESLPGSQVLTFSAGITVSNYFNLGDLVQGSVSNSVGIITARNDGARTITVQLLTLTATPSLSGGAASGSVAFTTADLVVGPGGGLTPSSVAAIGNPQAVTYWDDEVMNTFRGWPQSCFVDQNRLGFCDFPAVPAGISWSALGLPNDLYPGALPTDAIFELAPNRSRVYYVVPGMDSSEFVFCDNALYYIPITVTNPLKPGSVQFSKVSEDECAQVQPRRAGEFMLYVSGGGNQVMAVHIYGAYTRAYKTETVTDLSAHLFTSIKGIAIMTASASFPERYCFVLNDDGSVIVGKYSTDKNNDLAAYIGWTPWTGIGTVKWVACKGGNTIFTTTYSGAGIVEVLDNSRYLDASQLYNTQPVGLPIPGGKGPLWWQVNQNVDLMDGPLGTRMMGTYTVDANGFLIPQGNAGEDFTSVNLRVGQAWTARVEPFVPGAQPGQDVKQRMNKRGIVQLTVYVTNSTGFVLAGQLKSGTTLPGGPALGTVMQQWRIDTWNQDEDPTQPPPLREESYERAPTGRDHDPRWAVIKDTPGPITILELATEVSV